MTAVAEATHTHEENKTFALSCFINGTIMTNQTNETLLSCNLTQLSSFIEIKTNETRQEAENFTILQLAGYASRQELELNASDIAYRIAIVNSSVSLEIVKLISSFKDAAANESFAMLIEKFNSSISVYDSTVNERLENIKLRYVSKEEAKERDANLTVLMNANGQYIIAKIDSDNFLTRIAMAFLVAGIAVFLWKKPAQKTEQKVSILSAGGEKMSIEDMINPEYQKAVREAYNLKVAVKKMSLPEPVARKAFERIDEGVITKDNLHQILEGIKAEHQETSAKIKELKKKAQTHEKKHKKHNKA